MASWEVCIDSMGCSIRVAEGRGGGWLHGRYALTPWDAASELLKVEGEVDEIYYLKGDSCVALFVH